MIIKKKNLEKGIVIGLIVDENQPKDVFQFVELVGKNNDRKNLLKEERIHLVIVDLVWRHEKKLIDDVYNKMIEEELIDYTQLFKRHNHDINEKFIARNIVIDESSLDHVTFVDLSLVYRDEMIFEDKINMILMNSKKLRESKELFINFNGKFVFDDEGVFKTDLFLTYGPFLTTNIGWTDKPNKKNHYAERLKNVK